MDEIRIDAFFHRLHDIEAGHEFLDTVQLFRWDGFQGKTKIMMGAVGDPIAHDVASFIAVLADAEHARGNYRNVFFIAPCRESAFTDFIFRPLEHRQIKAGAENDAVGSAAGELQSLWPLG